MKSPSQGKDVAGAKSRTEISKRRYRSLAVAHVCNQVAQLLRANDSQTTTHNEKPWPGGTGAKLSTSVRNSQTDPFRPKECLAGIKHRNGESSALGL
jgi:hypothetical protein